jgi:hypothetical protein
MAISLMVALFGGLLYLCLPLDGAPLLTRVAELGKWAFILGLGTFLLGK